MNYLIVGYGNSLRRDDGVGRQVAEQVAAWNLPLVSSLSVHQLTPELAESIAHTDVVLFVDAIVGQENQNQTRIERLQGKDFQLSCDHLWSANGLLQLARMLYGASPIAYQILIPAMQFDYGATLSATAREGMNWALAKIEEVIVGEGRMGERRWR